MNHPRELNQAQLAQAFADYRQNTAFRINEKTEAQAQGEGARVGHNVAVVGRLDPPALHQ